MTMRITGLASGMDTEKMIQDMMKAERMRVNTVQRQKIWVQWQQEAYRNLIQKTRSFQSQHLDVLNNQKNMRSASSFAKFNYDITSGGDPTSAVAVTASANAQSRNVTISEIEQLATADKLEGDRSKGGLRSIYSGEISGNTSVKFNLTIGNSTRMIEANGSDADTLKENLNQAIGESFGEEYNQMVSVENNRLRFDLPGQTVLITSYDGGGGSLPPGISSGASSEAYRNKDIGELFGSSLFDDGKLSFEINGGSVELTADMNIREMMDVINRADLGVKMSYSAIADRFTLESTQEGSANNMVIGKEGDEGKTADFLKNVFRVDDLDDENFRSKGQNARLTIDGVQIVQSQNTFTLDGMTYTLRATHVQTDPPSPDFKPINVNVQTNVDELVDQITHFINDYNELLDTLSAPRNERRNYDFQPLTDEERGELSEKELELWDEKAKSGVLRGASELDTMVMRMRNALLEPVAGVALTMSDIGIRSGSYKDRGRLIIDEDQLRKALENDYEEVVKLFSQSSEHAYGDGAKAADRQKQSGIAHRLDDIFRDYTRTIRGASGRKGIMVERAGIEADSSVSQNLLSRQLDQFDQRIERLEQYLADRENYYYRMFARMEAAMAEMHSQSASMYSMLGM